MSRPTDPLPAPVPSIDPGRRRVLRAAWAVPAGAVLASAVGARVRGLEPASAPTDAGTGPVETKFASLLPLSTWPGGGAWAIISKWGQTTTLCNGGIIVGREAVMIVEGFYTPAGAQWAARTARQLSGRDPTHVVVSHYHFDHADGLSGYLALPVPPAILSTVTTRRSIADRGARGGGNLLFPAPESGVPGLQRSLALCVVPDTVIEDGVGPLTLNLGGRSVVLREREGHTDSDLCVELPGAGPAGEKIVFAGDLVFNRVFPVYLDARPSVLRRNVAELAADDGGKNIIVPGHGPLTTGAGLGAFIELIDELMRAGAAAHAEGLSAKEAAERYVLPDKFKGDYTPSNPLFVELAFRAAYKEIEAPKRP